MKMAKASDEEWQKVMDFANGLDERLNDQYTPDAELGRWVKENTPPLFRVVYGYRVLIDNCCDPKSDTLVFNQKFSELLQFQEAAV